MVIDNGWREVADTALAFVRRWPGANQTASGPRDFNHMQLRPRETYYLTPTKGSELMVDS